MLVRIIHKDGPLLISMSREVYDVLLENWYTPDSLKNGFETGEIIETDDILGIEVLVDEDE